VNSFSNFLSRTQHYSLTIGVLGCALSLFLPKAIGFLFALLSIVGAIGRCSGFFRHPLTIVAGVLLGWLSISKFWTSAINQSSTREYFVSIGLYSLLLWVPLLTLVVPAQLAQKALRYFCASAIVVTLVILINRVIPLPEAVIWHNIIFYTGNKSISISILLACGSGFLLASAMAEPNEVGMSNALHSWVPLGAALCAWVVLFTAQSRSAVLILPFCILAVLIREKFSLKSKIFVCGAAIVLTAGVMATSASVSDRIKQAIVGTQSSITGQNNSSATAATNSMIVRGEMNRLSLQMIAQKPLTGHGLGSWTQQWEEFRKQTGAHSSVTAHNEYFGLASQAGLPALLLLLAFFALCARGLLHAPEPWATCAIITLLTWAIASIVNATLRDTVFSVPLLFLLGITLAAIKPTEESGSTH
jgi:O-antigen ligase